MVKLVTLGEVKMSNTINFGPHVNFKDFFLYQTVCVLTNERYKTYHMGFSLCHLGHAPGVGLWGAGCPWVIFFYSIKIMWHIKSTGMATEQNASKIFILGPN